jgi:hypothetical protein
VYCVVRQPAHDDSLWIYHGRVLRHLKSMRINEVDNLGVWHGGPAKWDWTEISRVLRGATDITI